MKLYQGSFKFESVLGPQQITLFFFFFEVQKSHFSGRKAALSTKENNQMAIEDEEGKISHESHYFFPGR